MTGDYYLTLRVQHGRIKEAMQQLGIKTASELARRSGASPSMAGKLLNFKISPRLSFATGRGRRNPGGWRLDATRIASALGMAPEDLFPDHLHHEVTTNQIESFADEAQLSHLLPAVPEPYAQLEQHEAFDELYAVLEEALTDRERAVIEARFFDDKQLADCGIPISRERVRQIEAKALRKLRHPSRLSRLDGGMKFYREVPA